MFGIERTPYIRERNSVLGLLNASPDAPNPRVVPWTEEPLESGTEFDPLNVESITVAIQSADDFYLFTLILPGPVVVIELVDRIVARLQDVFLAPPHDDACNTLPGRLRL